MIRQLSALDPTQSYEIVAAIVGIVAVSLAGLALAASAIWKVRAADPLAGWLLVAAGLVQPVAFAVVLPLAFSYARSLLAVYGAEESPMVWTAVLPACRIVIVLSLATLVADAAVAWAALSLAGRR